MVAPQPPTLRPFARPLDMKRDKHRRLLPRLAPPGLQQPGIDPTAAGQIRYVDARPQALSDHCRLLLRRPPAPTGCPRDQLNPAVVTSFVPVLMPMLIRGIIAETVHRFTRERHLCAASANQPPCRQGGALAAVTIYRGCFGSSAFRAINMTLVCPR